jgi:hypothetical protein
LLSHCQIEFIEFKTNPFTIKSKYPIQCAMILGWEILSVQKHIETSLFVHVRAIDFPAVGCDRFKGYGSTGKNRNFHFTWRACEIIGLGILLGK